jgi:hypothetical protein
MKNITSWDIKLEMGEINNYIERSDAIRYYIAIICNI